MTEEYSVDFHIHGTFSGATSDRMIFSKIAEQSVYKGLDFVGTGDILHPRWLKMLRDELERVDEGTYIHPLHGTKFVLTVEIEDKSRVHHLVLVPSLSKVEELRERLSSFSSDMNIDGRPSVDIEAPRLTEIVTDAGCLIGPAHAFTPWTSIFKEFNSLLDCYGDQVGRIDFLELGLSADTYMADRISELKKIPFLSNSDAHSPWPNRLGREFNRFRCKDPTFSDLLRSIRQGENITLNVGLSPKLGKYHLSACSRCYKRYSLEDAKSLDWRCDECGGSIKKGVSDRIQELSDRDLSRDSGSRPKYLHIAPLSEVISLSQDRANPHSSGVQKVWSLLVKRFDDEISVLVDVPVSEIEEEVSSDLAFMIQAFREGELDITPGGGGEYGRLKVPPKIIKAQKRENQKTLLDFGD